MVMPPSCASFAIFPDKDSQSHAGATVAGLAALTKFHQPIAQFIVVWRWRCGSNRNRLRRSRAIAWRNNDPSSITPLLITSVTVIAVAARPWLALCRDRSARCPTDDRANHRSPAATYGAANNGPGSAAQDCAADRILRGGILQWHRKRNGQKG